MGYLCPCFRIAPQKGLDLIEDVLKDLERKINRYKKDETYLTAKQAVEWGFADEIFDGDWKSLTKYTNQQRQRKG